MCPSGLNQMKATSTWRYYTDMARPNSYGIFPHVLELPRFISKWIHKEIYLDNMTTLRLCWNHKQGDGKDRI